MSDICWNCGEEIEFRWVDGCVRPIHESGQWCPGYDAGYAPRLSAPRVARPPRAPREAASARWSVGHARCDLGVPLTHPTECPVCGERIFFHTNGNGDCVFFDSLGKPWPKHPCLSTDEGIRKASRSRPLMRIVDLVVPPTHIPIPAGVTITEFDHSKVEQVVVGVVLSFKKKRVWRSQSGTAARKQTDLLSVIIQTSPAEVIRVYTPLGLHVEVGQVVRMAIHEEWFDGRQAMYADAGGLVTPEDEDTVGDA